MQIKSLRIKSYRSWRIDDNTSAEALGRLKQLDWVERLRREGCSEATSPAVVGWSRATYYRWLKRYREAGLKGLESGTRAPWGRRICQWTKQQEQQVLHLRKRYPLWGKCKRRFPSVPCRWTAVRSSGMSLSRPAETWASPCMCCPRKTRIQRLCGARQQRP